MKLRIFTFIIMLFALTSNAQQTVVDVIVNSEDHTTLEAAVTAAELAETLSGEGPFTVFAPTDAAFEALPEGTLDALLANPSGDLTKILLYHVLGATVLSTDLMDGQTATTLNGKDITVTINDEGVFINDAKVTTADIETDNGVVHVIDAVLLPPDVGTSLEIYNTGFQVFPNPTKGFVQINLSAQTKSIDEIRLYNISGKLVANEILKNQPSVFQFYLGEQPKGLYRVELINENSIYTKKIIVE